MHRQENDFRGGRDFLNLPCGFVAIHYWHSDIQNHDIWLASSHFLYRRHAVSGFTANFPTLGFDDATYTTPHDLVVVNYKYSQETYSVGDEKGYQVRTIAI